jgi:hypothetical protein
MQGEETELDKMLRLVNANNDKLDAQFQRANAREMRQIDERKRRAELARAVRPAKPVPAYVPRDVGARLVKRVMPAARPLTPAMMRDGLTLDLRKLITVPDAKEVAATIAAASDPAFSTFFDVANYRGRLHDEKVYAAADTLGGPHLVPLDASASDVARVPAMLHDLQAWVDRFKKMASLDAIKMSKANVKDRSAFELNCDRAMRRSKRVFGNVVDIFLDAIEDKRVVLALSTDVKYMVMHCLDGSPYKGDEHTTRSVDQMRSMMTVDSVLMHDVIKIQAKLIAHVLEGTKELSMHAVSMLQAESVFDSGIPLSR